MDHYPKGPNMYPSGIIPLDSFGDADGGGRAGVDTQDVSGRRDTEQVIIEQAQDQLM